MADLLEMAYESDDHSAPQDDGAELVTYYSDSMTWFEEWFSQVFERHAKKDLAWCPEWWTHPEAALNVEVLWRSWEAARIDDAPSAMLDWIERARASLRALTDRDAGPFSLCTPTEHGTYMSLQLAHTPPPEAQA